LTRNSGDVGWGGSGGGHLSSSQSRVDLGLFNETGGDMKSKPESEEVARRGGGGKAEFSPVRTSASVAVGRGARQPNVGPRTSKRTGGPGGGASPSPAPGGRATISSSSPGPGRTPQTKRRELSLTVTEKNSPTGSPRSGKPSTPASVGRKTACPTKATSSASSKSDQQREVNQNFCSYEESSRKSSASSQDSGIGRETKLSVRVDRVARGARGGRGPPTIRTISPEIVDQEVSNRKKFSELCDVKNIELGIVKVPPELLEDLIHKEKIEKFYSVDPVPVASGLFATVRKCTNKDTGVEYAAKFSSRFRCGVDCTTEVLHEIALLSICAESNKIVHLKDVFQNQHEIVLVLEYAPGGDFQSVLDDDMVPFEQDVQGFMLQLLEAISYVHERNIAHLDIKPQNIVLMSEFPNCEIKLCDLEVSRVIQENEEIREIIGTPDYVAPEILAYEPISLAADIWSLGVLAYVLLTGFSPFGGDTDQETLRNITTANLDFPGELFEGVSDEAKDFIADCLLRNPKKRPTVSQCLSHPWISANSEPPSPSPLMLKIPTPEHHFVPGHSNHVSGHSNHGNSQAKLSVHSGGGNSGSSRRSCQTCRDKITERKRYLSKSREAIFEKVANSNLKKSLSKSRERLCDMRMTLSKSRDFLNETKIASRSQEKFLSFKSLSKSQEVLSQALGGNMKRMVNGAVSDISPAHLPLHPRVYLDTTDTFDNFVILPGSSVLMSHTDLMSKSSSSLQFLGAISESGRSTPASICSNATIADINYTEPNNERPPSAKPETVIEVSEEDLDEEDNKQKTDRSNEAIIEQMMKKDEANQVIIAERRRGGGQGTYLEKEEKNNLNYETKQSMTRSTSVDKLNSSNRGRHIAETAEVAVQVNLNNNDEENKEEKEDNNNTKASMTGDIGSTKASLLRIPVDGNIRGDKKLTRGFSHDDTLGDEQKRYSWREELEKFQQMKKPLAVSDLIDAFSNKSSIRKVSADDPTFPNVDSLKNKRRGSLQIQIDSTALAKLAESVEKNEKAINAIKLQRRKSTSAILPIRLGEVKMPDIEEKNSPNLGLNKIEINTTEQCTEQKPISHTAVNNCEVTGRQEVDSKTNTVGDGDVHSLAKGRVYLEKVNERKRTWDYFEINHPKAISDKKLEQLKAKYTRRKTEASLQSNTEPSTKDKNGNEKPVGQKGALRHPPQLRTASMPLLGGLPALEKSKPASNVGLDLAWDPLTGECIPGDDESVDSGRDSEPVSLRKISSEVELSSDQSEGGSRKSSRRKSSQLGEILEQERGGSGTVLECFIDPFTGQFITTEVSKQPAAGPAKLKVDLVTPSHATNGQADDGIGSLPHTPTDIKHSQSDIKYTPTDTKLQTDVNSAEPSEPTEHSTALSFQEGLEVPSVLAGGGEGSEQ